MYNITVVPPWQREYKRGDRPLYQRVIQKWKEEEPLLAKEQFNWVYDGGKIMYSTKYIQNTEKRSWTVKVKETMEAEQEREQPLPRRIVALELLGGDEAGASREKKERRRRRHKQTYPGNAT